MRSLKVSLYIFDVIMHSAVIFGWSSISQIIKENGFFLSEGTLSKRDSRAGELENLDLNQNASESCFAVSEEEGTQSKEISLIMILATSLFGLSMLFHGLLRDYVSNGVARVEMYFFLSNVFIIIEFLKFVPALFCHYLKTFKSLTYILLGISTPGSSDSLQYFWIIQYGTSTGAFLSGLQYFTLFPQRVGLLIGIANGLAHASSIWPQLWLILIRKDLLTYSQIMFIWAGLGNF